MSRPRMTTQMSTVSFVIHDRLKTPDIHRRLRAEAYKFLERPSGVHPLHIVYHLAVFFYVLIALCLSAILTVEEYKTDTTMQRTVFAMEIGLAIYFAVEFTLRLWAVGADAKYQHFSGRMRYMKSFLPLVDVLILVTTFIFLFLWSNEGSLLGAQTFQNLRFLQILRLLHIDRKLSTWRMMKQVVLLHKTELITTYYIALIVVFTMAAIVYWTEDEHEAAYPPSDNETTFRNYGDALWWAVISLTTIGYGDISPNGWLSKVITVIFAVFCVLFFTMASSIIGVGLSLMVEDKEREKSRRKIEPVAARVIQAFYRHRLMTRKFDQFHMYRKMAHRLRKYEMFIRDEASLSLEVSPSLDQHHHEEGQHDDMLHRRLLPLLKRFSASVLALHTGLIRRGSTDMTNSNPSLLRRNGSISLPTSPLAKGKPKTQDGEEEDTDTDSSSPTPSGFNPTKRHSDTILAANAQLIRLKQSMASQTLPPSPMATRRHLGDDDLMQTPPTSVVDLREHHPPQIVIDAASTTTRATTEGPGATPALSRSSSADSFLPRTPRSHSLQRDNLDSYHSSHSSSRYQATLVSIWKMRTLAAVRRFKLTRTPLEQRDISEEVGSQEKLQLQRLAQVQISLERLTGKPQTSQLRLVRPATAATSAHNVQTRLSLVERKLAQMEEKADRLLDVITALADKVAAANAATIAAAAAVSTSPPLLHRKALLRQASLGRRGSNFN